MYVGNLGLGEGGGATLGDWGTVGGNSKGSLYGKKCTDVIVKLRRRSVTKYPARWSASS